MSIIVSWVVLTLGMFLAARLLPRMELRGGVGSHLLVSATFGLILSITGWWFHLALGFLSFGVLFIFGFIAEVLVAAIVLKITDAFYDRLKVDGLGTALLAALILSATDTAARLVMFALA